MTNKPTNNWYAMEPTVDAEGNATSSADVYIYDEIGGYGVDAKSFMSSLDELGEIENINLRINSPGGSITEGNAIFNALKRHSAKVTTYIDGIAASMGSVIAMAGDEIRMASNAFLMIHNPWTVSIGDSEQLRKDADLMDKMKLNIINAYSRSGYSAEELNDLMDAETWLTADEALAADFVDSIDTGLEAAASITDMNASLKKIDKSLPMDKVVASITEKHESAVAKIKAEYDSEIKELNAEVKSGLEQLAKNAADIANLTKERDELNETVDALEIKHELDLKAANEVSAKAIAESAAELMLQNTVRPVTADNESHVEVFASSDEYWAEYNRQHPSEKHAWHEANKARLP